MAKILSFGNNPKPGKDNIFVSLWESFQSLNFFVRVYILTGILIVASTPFIVSNIQTITQHAQVSACTRTYSGNVTLPKLDVAASETVCFDPNTNTIMELSGNAIVNGVLRMKPASSGITHTLRFTGANENAFVGGGLDPVASDVGLWVIGAGKLDISGAARTGWARAANSLSAGGTSITLDVAPVGWGIGDEVLIVPTAIGATEPASTLNRLREFFELFLSDGLNSEFAYLFGLRNV